MSVSNSMIQRASRITGVPVWLLKAVDAKEGSGTSPAGAQGEFQLMPGTAKGLERKYKINTKTTWGNLLGGAYYLAEQHRTFKRWDYALAAYNAGPNAVRDYDGIPPYKETQDYVRTIMGKKVAGGGVGARDLGVASLDSGGLSPAPPAPSYTQQDAAMEGLHALASGNYDPTKGLAALRQAAEATAAAQQAAPAMQAQAQDVAQPLAAGNWSKWVKLAKGADRPGATTSESVLQFVGMLGKRARRRLVIGTGTAHNQFVVGTQRESAHWTGHAADIPASGAALTRLGRLALIQAGMPRREAMKVKGGLFNIGGYQVIFNTNEGGNHYNHLHVGVRG